MPAAVRSSLVSEVEGEAIWVNSGLTWFAGFAGFAGSGP